MSCGYRAGARRARRAWPDIQGCAPEGALPSERVEMQAHHNAQRRLALGGCRPARGTPVVIGVALGGKFLDS